MHAHKQITADAEHHAGIKIDTSWRGNSAAVAATWRYRTRPSTPRQTLDARVVPRRAVLLGAINAEPVTGACRAQSARRRIADLLGHLHHLLGGGATMRGSDAPVMAASNTPSGPARGKRRWMVLACGAHRQIARLGFSQRRSARGTADRACAAHIHRHFRGGKRMPLRSTTSRKLSAVSASKAARLAIRSIHRMRHVIGADDVGAGHLQPSKVMGIHGRTHSALKARRKRLQFNNDDSATGAGPVNEGARRSIRIDAFQATVNLDRTGSFVLSHTSSPLVRTQHNPIEHLYSARGQ